MELLSDVQQTFLFFAIVVCLGALVMLALLDLEKARSAWIGNRRRRESERPKRHEPFSQRLEP
jgi:hypothetical protein